MIQGSGGAATATISTARDFPSTVSYHQGRRLFGGSSDHPNTLWFTRSGNYNNMDTSEPVRADDAITATIAAQSANPIHSIIPVQQLIVLTLGGAWRISGGASSDVITPATILAQPQEWAGASDAVRPLVVGRDVIYVQAKGSTLRNLTYNEYSTTYLGTDLCMMSPHLFLGRSIVSIDSAQEPHKIIWCVRDDGILLGLTYVREQEVFAWHHHDTAGNFKDVCVIAEANAYGALEDVPYFIVQRTINGQAIQCIERFHTRQLGNFNDDVTESWFVDCGLQYRGAPATVISGLGHLEGATVSILADGSVMPQQAVTGGAVTLDAPASLVTVGLPYVAELQTLPLDVGEPTAQGKRKRISRIRLYLENTRGLKAGPVNALKGPLLTEFKERTNEPWGAPTRMTTGQEFVNTAGNWDVFGTVFIRQDQPLPASVLGVEPEFEIAT